MNELTMFGTNRLLLLTLALLKDSEKERVWTLLTDGLDIHF